MSEATTSARKNDKTPFHLVVVHHSPASKKMTRAGQVKGLNPASEHELSVVARHSSVAGLLTGHAHSYRIEPKGALPVEVRCPTTTQANLVSPQHRGFLLHDLDDNNARLDWHVTPYWFTGTRFAPGARVPVSW